jgi:hypothetical protein
VRDADAADDSAGLGDAEGGVRRQLAADAFHDGVGAISVGEVLELRNSLITASGDDVVGSPLAGQMASVGSLTVGLGRSSIEMSPLPLKMPFSWLSP